MMMAVPAIWRNNDSLILLRRLNILQSKAIQSIVESTHLLLFVYSFAYLTEYHVFRINILVKQ